MHSQKVIFKTGNGESGNPEIGESGNWGIRKLGNPGIIEIKFKKLKSITASNIVRFAIDLAGDFYNFIICLSFVPNVEKGYILVLVFRTKENLNWTYYSLYRNSNRRSLNAPVNHDV